MLDEEAVYSDSAEERRGGTGKERRPRDSSGARPRRHCKFLDVEAAGASSSEADVATDEDEAGSLVDFVVADDQASDTRSDSTSSCGGSCAASSVLDEEAVYSDSAEERGGGTGTR